MAVRGASIARVLGLYRSHYWMLVSDLKKLIRLFQQSYESLKAKGLHLKSTLLFSWEKIVL